MTMNRRLVVLVGLFGLASLVACGDRIHGTSASRSVGSTNAAESIDFRGSALALTSSTSIIDAINNGAPGSTIAIGAGTFVIPSTLRPKEGMKILGQGAGRTILVADEAWDPGITGLPDGEIDESTVRKDAYMFDLSGGVKNVLFSHLTLKGPKLHGAIFGSDSDDLEIRYSRFDSFRYTAIRTFLLSRGRIHNNEFVDAGGTVNSSGAAFFGTWFEDTEIYNNLITQTAAHPNHYYGIKGREARRVRIHHNDIRVGFSIELPFENDHTVEIDHNRLMSAVSLPKHAGGDVPQGGYSFKIHHNWFQDSYSIEYPRNAVEISHNLFDFDHTKDHGNLISYFADVPYPGGTKFHNNMIKNPGRGIFWSPGAPGRFEFYNNHVMGRTTVTPRTEGLFDVPSTSDFNQIVIRDNIFEFDGQTRPLVRNSASYAAKVENNSFRGISDAGSFANAPAARPKGPLARLAFDVGVNGAYQVEGWNARFKNTNTSPIAAPHFVSSADTHVRGGTYAGQNFGNSVNLEVKRDASQDAIRYAYIRFDLGPAPATIANGRLRLFPTYLGTDARSMTIQVRRLARDDWDETTTTWRNLSADGDVIATIAGSTLRVGTPIEIPINAALQQEITKDKRISLALVTTSAAGAQRIAMFASQEHPNAAARPALLFTPR